GSFGGGIRGFIPLPGQPALVEGAVIADRRGVSANISRAVSIGPRNVVEVGRERTTRRQFRHHFVGIIGLGRVLPVTARAILGRIVVGRFVPLIIGGKKIIPIGISLTDHVIVRKGVGTRF